jgi:uncharacterized protein YhfF
MLRPMLALILDRTHAVLLEGDGLPTFLPDGTARALRPIIVHFAARGVALSSPAGSRARADGAGRDFVFVIDRVPAPPGMTWRQLREANRDDALWQLYTTCMLGGWEPPTRDVDVWSFGFEREMAAQLAHLVTCGEKRVTMGWIEASAHSGTPLAYLDGVSVVTDGFGYPRVVVRTAEVRDVPFDEIDAATIAGEGEGDLGHDDWREAHTAYFSGEAARHGLTFDERILLSVERFEVLHVVGRAD